MAIGEQHERTEVLIVGAGPAGLVLAHLLRRAGIDCIVLEDRSRAYVEARVRAGVLEHPTVELLRELGVADRLDREALHHRGVEFAFAGERRRLDFLDLVGRSITIYGQQEVVKDLIASWLGAGGDLRFEAEDVRLHDLTSATPSVTFRDERGEHRIEARLIAGCDGFHGVCRPSIPAGQLQVIERVYPFAWLGILAEAPPTTEELIYSSHERGFALYSMRSPRVTRLYLQVAPDEDLDAWSDERIWDELAVRLPTGAGLDLRRGPIIDRAITGMRSFVATPMRHGSLLLAGDAAHIVPPTGAKGLNLAVADVVVLADVAERYLRRNDPSGLDRYSEICLQRVWRVQRFAWRMTAMLHRFDGDDEFGRWLRLAELDEVTATPAAAAALAESYVGLPFARC